MWFKLVTGKSQGADMTQKPDARGRYTSKMYDAGDVFECNVDLEKLHGSHKFLKVDGPKGAPMRAKKMSQTNPSEFDEAPAYPGEGEEGVEGEDKLSAGQSPAPIKNPDKDMEYLTANYGPIEEMTAQDMRDVCSAEEIDTSGCRTKEDFKSRILDHFSA